MNRSRTAWPDTTHTDPPCDHPYRAIFWLLGRHPRVAVLAQRLGIVGPRDPEYYSEPWMNGIDLDAQALGDGILLYDQNARAFKEYADRHPAPGDRPGDSEADAYRRYDAWEEAGPHLPDTRAGRVATAFGPMSGGERRVIRLLAALTNSGGHFTLGYVEGLDDSYQAFVQDWAQLSMRRSSTWRQRRLVLPRV